MDRLDATQARDHLELVERILAESHSRLCAGGEYFVAWGIGSAAVPLIIGLVKNGVVPGATLWLVPAILAACGAFSVLRGAFTRRTLSRASLVQREFFNVLWLTVGVAFIVTVAGFRIFEGAAAAGIWSVVETIVLLYIGMHGNRRAQICGVIVLASLIVANFSPSAVVGYVLAAGMFLGYAGFGASELLARD